MNGYFIKNPDAVHDYSFDWQPYLNAPAEVIEEDLGWRIEPGGSSAAIEDETRTAAITTVRISGGTPGAVYQIRTAVLTNMGRRLSRALTLRIEHN